MFKAMLCVAFFVYFPGFDKKSTGGTLEIRNFEAEEESTVK